MQQNEKCTQEKIEKLFATSLMELIAKALTTHAQHFHLSELELCTLQSIKTGLCPEDCAYCPQSAHYRTDVEPQKLLPLDVVIAQAKEAHQNGATRFCMGAAWRNPPKKEFPQVLEMIRAVKKLGLETCVTLGMLTHEQAGELKAAGLDFYNHNLDTSPEYYKKIITTRTYEDRLQTLQRVLDAGIKVCCGGIIGMGETREDRIQFLLQLIRLNKPPESVPINRLLPIKGTPLATMDTIANIEFVRTIAVTRILLPTSIIRLSAGRACMSQEMQMLCFLAGANSIWLGDKLLTAPNSPHQEDFHFLRELGMKTRLTSKMDKNE